MSVNKDVRGNEMGASLEVEQLLRATLRPALGCTEPVAVAYAVAAAIQAPMGWLPGKIDAFTGDLDQADIDRVCVAVNRNVFKNAFSITIPNAGGHKGIVMAAALGPWCNPDAGLEIFAGVDKRTVLAAQRLIERGAVSVEVVAVEHTDLYIAASARFRRSGSIREGSSLLEDEHTNLILVKSDGKEVFRRVPSGHSPAASPIEGLSKLTFHDLVRMAEDLSEGSRDLIRQTIDLNRRASESGLSEPLGLGIGFYGVEDSASPGSAAQLSGAAAAGSDARMSGHPVKVMSSAGSGNQGIVATMPILAYCREKGTDEEVLLRAVALSHIVTLYITSHMGYLTSLCGVAIKAGLGAACGLTYAMGGRSAEVQRAVKIMAATLSGVICDGAKPGCALKVKSAADMAVQAASLAMKHVEVSGENGIVADTAEETIRNLGQLNESMKDADEKVVELIQRKMVRP
jgi:L-cysteine desulfidase